ncbi:related to mtw1-component of the mind kinetochore complex [Ceraceosorus bombacis]|uniref:Related to mtw1-component of the mind kinetochore complex n=1 Tax=Ceraceosorus bombacis TaxID=401625 RepID=A0A0P1BAL0_9BASI|nr:related to mtw1-component of the mind kinetochore complex [Ceraceosorus bombacis]
MQLTEARRVTRPPRVQERWSLLTEHLGFNPKTFIDDLVYTSNEHLYFIAEQFENHVKHCLKGQEDGDRQAEQGVHALLTLLENALDATFDTLELYCLRHVFGITPRQAALITLPHHRGLDLRPAASRSRDGDNVDASAPQSSKARRKSSSSKRNEEHIGHAATSARQESEQLAEQERLLRRKITAARAVKHSLVLATEAAKRKLHRAESVLSTFSAILSQDPTSFTSAPIIPTTLPQATRKMLTDTSELISSLEALRAVDPLGASLSIEDRPGGSGPTSASSSDRTGASGSGSTKEKAWKGDRDKYVAWEANQIIAGVKAKQRERERSIASAAAASADAAASTEGGPSAAGKGGERKSQAPGTPRGNKRGNAAAEGTAVSKRKSAR